MHFSEHNKFTTNEFLIYNMCSKEIQYQLKKVLHQSTLAIIIADIVIADEQNIMKLILRFTGVILKTLANVAEHGLFSIP